MIAAGAATVRCGETGVAGWLACRVRVRVVLACVPHAHWGPAPLALSLQSQIPHGHTAAAPAAPPRSPPAAMMRSCSSVFSATRWLPLICMGHWQCGCARQYRAVSARQQLSALQCSRPPWYRHRRLLAPLAPLRHRAPHAHRVPDSLIPPSYGPLAVSPPQSRCRCPGRRVSRPRLRPAAPSPPRKKEESELESGTGSGTSTKSM